MVDFKCPSCHGGFPAAYADGECPWCGESMAGVDSSPVTPAASSRFPPDDRVRDPDRGIGLPDFTPEFDHSVGGAGTDNGLPYEPGLGARAGDLR